MLRLALFKLVSVFCRRKRDVKDEIYKFAHSILPQGEALRAFLEEIRMLMEVERKLKGMISEETKNFANAVVLTVLLARQYNKQDR